MQKFDLPSFDACRMENAYGAADPELGPVPVPGSEVAGNKLNEDGMRGPLLPIKKKPGNLRILFLGDSTCWGIGVKILTVKSNTYWEPFRDIVPINPGLC
jgi:hypothetical protein